MIKNRITENNQLNWNCPSRIYPGSYYLNEVNCSQSTTLRAHCLLCTASFSQCLPYWLGQGQIRGNAPPVSICPFYLRKMLAATLPVCPAFESITPPNRLTINAHIADYISDGYLGGKHLNDSTNRHSTVTDTSLCLAKSCHTAGAVDSRSPSATTQLCQFLVETDIYAILVPSDVGNL